MVFKHQFPYSIFLITIIISLLVFAFRPHIVDIVGGYYVLGGTIHVYGYVFNYKGQGVPVEVSVNNIKVNSTNGFFCIIISHPPKYDGVLKINFTSIHKEIEVKTLSDSSTFYYSTYADEVISSGNITEIVVDGNEVILNSSSVLRQSVNYHSIPYGQFMTMFLMVLSFSLSSFATYKVFSPFPRKYYLVINRLGVDMILPSIISLCTLSLVISIIMAIPFAEYYSDPSVFIIVPYTLAYSVALSGLSILGSTNMIKLSPTVIGYVLSIFYDHLPIYLLFLSLISPMFLWYKDKN
ncbi:hypothetical protein KN1_15940 [Stygiolobus caldivivus]|uniref:Uncharacterized protein n=2 Tax=Stygiolobus caldivivus TaxID=2824673 RepID=A0A8D5U7A1_9CREN|nr:hypothetical protein KN1_15940 [Stygiolobus caldivivus]